MAISSIAVVDDTVEQKLQVTGQLMVEQARSITIDNHADYEQAGRMLVEIKARTKQVKDYWQKPKADAAAAHKTICDREKAMIAPLVEAEKIIKATMVAYTEAVDKARREASEEARRRQQEETNRLLEQAVIAESSGDDQAAAVSMAMAQMIDDMQPTQNIARPTAAGTSIRKVWKARVTDPKAVPAYVNGIEIRTIQMSALNSIAKMTNGTLEIPGVEFYLESSLSVRG